MRRGHLIISIILVGFLSLVVSHPADAASQAQIWDQNTAAWITTLNNGDALGPGIGQNERNYPQTAIDSHGYIYVAFLYVNHVYLSRYDGTSVKIWDNGAAAWTTTFANGDPIDRGMATNAFTPSISIDHLDNVYVVFSQHDIATNGYQQLYVSRYNGTDVRIWDNDTASWTTTFTNGDPFSGLRYGDLDFTYPIVVDANNNVYIAFRGRVGQITRIYLARYNGTRMEVWDNDTSAWITDFTGSDPIDTGTDNSGDLPQTVIDSNNNVYVTYQKSNGTKKHIYLSRYDGTSVKIWDNDTASWTTTFASGDPIDTGIAQDAINPQIAKDSNNNIYVTYSQSDGAKTHIYLSRYDGTSVKIWDNGASAWTTTFGNGDSIDKGTADNATFPQIAIDSNNIVYISYLQILNTLDSAYLSRYDGTSVKIWDNGASTWTTTFANGDPINLSPTYAIGVFEGVDIVIDSDNKVYVIIDQLDPAEALLGNYVLNLYLSRYDGTNVKIWDTDTSSWNTDFTTGDRFNYNLDTVLTRRADAVIDSSNNIYFTYDSGADGGWTFFSRYYNDEPTDTTPPTITLATSTATTTTATVTWTTDEAATSQVEYGPSSSYGALTTAADLAGVTSHTVSLTNLLSCANYHYRVLSSDLTANSATTSDAVFTTTGCTSNATITASTTEAISTAASSTLTLTTSATESLTLAVPANYTATTSSAVFQIKQLGSTEFFTTVTAPTTFSAVGTHVYNLQAIVTATTTLATFVEPLTITLAYDLTTLGTLSESSLVIYRYDGSTWTALTSCTVNTSAHTVSCQTTAFSYFGLFGQVAVVTTTSQSTGSGTHFGCKDPQALNYEYFSSSRPSLCQYATTTSLLMINPVVTSSINIATTTFKFTRDLKFGLIHEDVRQLQKYLNATGYVIALTGPGSPGQETNYFGVLTRKAVIKLQLAKKVTPAVGYFGPVTRKVLGF